MTKNVMIIAGEASGDMHAAAMIRGMQSQQSDLSFYGIGGTQMRKLGVDILVDAKDLAVVGLFEVIAHRKVIFAALDQMRDCLKSRRPDLLILVDYAEFNLKLAEHAKKLGIKVLFYISPQVWAWRQGRVRKIKKRIDKMAVIFPFEADFYRKHNVPVEYTGHPLTGKVKPTVRKEEFIRKVELVQNKPIVGIFPGSRKSEIKRLLPILLSSASLVKKTLSETQFVLPVASTLDMDDFHPYLEGCALDIKLVEEDTYNFINICDAIMTVSVTVTLEIAMLKTPFVIINKLAWLSYFLVKHMIKIEFIGLCNIVVGKEVAREFIQQQATPANISAEIIKLLSDKAYYDEMRRELGSVEEKLAVLDKARPVHELALEMLG